MNTMNNINIINKIKLFRQLTKNSKEINEYLKLEEDIDEILGAIYSKKEFKKTGFNGECFFKYKKDEEDYLQLLECPQVEEGMFSCERCKSKKIFTMSKQTRSGDEATTVFARCSECKNGWIIN